MNARQELLYVSGRLVKRPQDSNTPMGVCEFCGEDTDFCDCEGK